WLALPIPLALVLPQARQVLRVEVVDLQLPDGLPALLGAQALVELDARPGPLIGAQTALPGARFGGVRRLRVAFPVGTRAPGRRLRQVAGNDGAQAQGDGQIQLFHRRLDEVSEASCFAVLETSRNRAWQPNAAVA